jgi:asparagine synthase (glutamine-hydrolysing)
MCGIVGLICGRAGNPELIERMVDPLVHRGPDDGGTWIDRDAAVALGHRRLAILDLSPQGHQPMISSDGRWVISYNGEIYNHRALRGELERAGLAPDRGWRGTSDTETLLQAIAAWGLEGALARATGMFAFGLWDRKERRLRLVRDRFGEKPLYYGWVGGDFAFASELKALLRHPKFGNEISRDALRAFAARIYVPAPLSIYRNLFKLPPGCILEVGADVAAAPLDEAPSEAAPGEHARLSRYWSYGEVLERGMADPITDEVEALEALEQALGEAIREQSIADVPVGAFLSGGIDSSTIVALYQKHSSLPVRSFTIGFEESHFNEADDARAVAQRLGTVHDEKRISAREAAAVIPLLPTMFDEPFGDSSQIPTFLVSSFARQQVTVALSGDGGDELFAGYRRYWEALSIWGKLRRIPLRARRAGAAAAERIPFKVWAAADRLMGAPQRSPFSGRVTKGLRAAASVESFDDLYRGYLDQWALEPSPVAGAGPCGAPFPLDPGFDVPDALKMTYCDALAYLPDDILCKVDRASMAVSLETRVPFLDRRVAELAARIPMSMKLERNNGKKILRALLARHLPPQLFDRPKSGFSMPLGDWLRGDLRDWAEDLLDPARMRADGYFDAELIQARWREHLAKRRNASSSIWAILMFQSWLRSTGSARSFEEARPHAA